MEFVIVGTFDHTGFYETRLILVLSGLLITFYKMRAARESRHLIIFLSSSVLMAGMEYVLQAGGLRGPGYAFSLFGRVVPNVYGPLLQGILEGGVCGLMALWFADLRTSRARLKEWVPYLLFACLVLSLAVFTGLLTKTQPVSSVQPIFSPTTILVITTIIFFSLLVAWWKDELSILANFYAGLLIFALLNFEPLQLLGARYVGLIEGAGTVRAGSFWQWTMMTLSYIYESAGGKLHYLMVPVALGLISSKLKSPDDSARLSYQHLQRLTERGWRKKSKPFQR
jgi:hypothetical protein